MSVIRRGSPASNGESPGREHEKIMELGSIRAILKTGFRVAQQLFRHAVRV